jgi:hypothetical protein
MNKKDCFLINDIKNIDEKSFLKIREYYENDFLKLFKIHNGSKKHVICLLDNKIDEFLEEIPLLLGTEIPIDILNETVRRISFEEFENDVMA